MKNKSKFKPGKTQTQQDKQTENWDICKINQERSKVKPGKTQIQQDKENQDIRIVNEE